MKATELIEKLQKIVDEHGNIEVYLYRDGEPDIDTVTAFERGWHDFRGVLHHEPLAVWIE